jgi:hypothetical protein
LTFVHVPPCLLNQFLYVFSRLSLRSTGFVHVARDWISCFPSGYLCLKN